MLLPKSVIASSEFFSLFLSPSTLTPKAENNKYFFFFFFLNERYIIDCYSDKKFNYVL